MMLEAKRQLGHKLRINLDAVIERLFANHFDDTLVANWDLCVPKYEKRDSLKDDYLRPLISLLIDYCDCDDENLLAVYLDERLRYAPHRLPITERKIFHRDLIGKDCSAIAGLFKDDGDIANVWFELHESLTEGAELKSLSVLAVGDCLFNEFRVFAPFAARKVGIELDIRCMYFSANYTTGMDHTEVLGYIERYPVDLVLLSFFSFDVLPGYSRMMISADTMSGEEIVSQCEMMVGLASEFIDNIRDATSIPFAVHNVSGLPLGRWRNLIPFLPPHSSKQRFALKCLNEAIESMIDAKSNTILIDEAELMRSKGYRNSGKDVVSQKRYKGMFHTSYFGQYLTEPYNILFSAYLQLHKCKVLLVDFDNTLWKGVMADGEVGQYKERQKLLIALKNVGVVLVAISKNNPDNIRWDEMEIKPEDFALLKISWNPKVKSILESAAELNLGKDSFVLIDDNRQERMQVENEIPEICTLDPDDPITWKKLTMVFEFPNTKETEEAKNRTALYRQQVERQKVINADVDYASMMHKLDLWYKYYTASRRDVQRVHELVSRTNQFNTTTCRYSTEELKRMIDAADTEVKVGEIGDKFGGLGIVAVIIMRFTSDMAIVDSFIMSCRAMGFGLENQLLCRVEKETKAKGVTKILGEFIPSNRNHPSQSLYPSNGYVECSGGWIKDLRRAKKCSDIAWFQQRD